MDSKGASLKGSIQLFADDRFCRPGCRNRICVPMNEPPNSLLQSKNAGHAQSELDESLAAADLGSPALDLDYAGEVVGDITRYEFYASDLSIFEMRGGPGQGYLDLLPTACIRAEGITQSHVVRKGVQ